MSQINQDLQASHYLLKILEKSKNMANTIIEESSGLTCIINDQCKILKGNLDLAKFLKIEDSERLLNENLSSLFVTEELEIFKSQLRKVDEKNRKVEFELSITLDEDTQLFFLWTVAAIEHESSTGEALFNVSGRDITLLRQSEKQLQEIFASIPLGILTLVKGGVIDGRYSTFLEALLGEDELVGKTINEILFSRAENSLSEKEKNSINGVLATIGDSELIIEIHKENFPNLIHYKNGTFCDRWLGINLQPISYQGTIRKILVIIEDKTNLVLLKEEQKRKDSINDVDIKRYLSIKHCDPKLVMSFKGEIQEQINKLPEYWEDNQPDKIRHSVHTIKGNARVMNLEGLTNYCHELEDQFRDVLLKDKLSEDEINQISEFCMQIFDEWREITQIFNSIFEKESEVNNEDVSDSPQLRTKISELFEKYNNLQERLLKAVGDGDDVKARALEINCEKLLLAIKKTMALSPENLKEKIEGRVKSASETLQKRVNLVCELDLHFLENKIEMLLSECLSHLVNNAIDHGLETEEERKKAGKSPEGQLKIKIFEKGSEIFGVVSDDGKGINVEKIKQKIVDKKILPLGDTYSKSNDEILQYIFYPGFSTAGKVTNISGRGVGLDMVKSELNSFGGGIHVTNNESGGTQFDFNIKAETLTFDWKILSVEEFTETLNELMLLDFKQELPIKINPALKNKLIFLDIKKVLGSLSVQLAIFGFSYKLLTVEIEPLKSDERKFQIIVKDFHKMKKEILDYEISCLEDLSNKIINLHGGSIKEGKETIDIELGHILKRDSIPPIKMGRRDSSNYEKEIKVILDWAKSYSIEIGFRKSGNDLCDFFIDDTISKLSHLNEKDIEKALKEKVIKILEDKIGEGLQASQPSQ